VFLDLRGRRAVSDPTNPAASAARERPSSVSVSSYLLMLVAALQVINLVIAGLFFGDVRDAYKQAYAGTEVANQAETIGSIAAIGGAVIGLLVAAGLVILALLNNRGKNPSRIVTWVVGGLFLCCSGLGLASSALVDRVGMNNANTNGPDPAELQRALDERLPNWYQPVTTTIGVLSVLSLLTALILLALPRSNEFFRRPQPTWEPPVPGSGYPGYPPAGGQGGQPGYQQPYGDQPGWQPPPGGGGSQPPPGSPNPPGR
jgi:hypothetical protein